MATLQAVETGTFVQRFESEAWAKLGPAWLTPLRMQAMARFTELGLPSRRTPSWEKTPLAPLRVDRLTPEPGTLDPAVLERAAFHDEAARIVLVDGRFDAKLSRLGDLPKGLTVETDADLTESVEGLLKEDAMAALSVAFAQSTLRLSVEKNAVLDHPVHVVHVHTRPNTRTAALLQWVAHEGAQASLVESHVGSAPGTLGLHQTLLNVHDRAHVRYIKQQLEHTAAAHYGALRADIHKDARLEAFLWSDGGVWARNEAVARLLHQGASASLDGLWLGRGEQLHDCPTRIEHRAPDTQSQELYKGILDDKSRGIFVGSILVAQDAQRVDSQQTNRNLLLSNKARVDTTPQLEIYADDVKCAHGSTIGQLDPDALFFLRARGIDAERAALILTKAFAGEVLGRLSVWGIRTRLERRLENWFKGSA